VDRAATALIGIRGAQSSDRPVDRQDAYLGAVDFYSGIIYQAMVSKPEMFTVLFAIPRTAGWLAQWEETIRDPERKIASPRQVYVGPAVREVARMREQLTR
jgi:citrate synthase